MGVEVNGMGELFEELDELGDDYGDDGIEWVVGTPVEYAAVVEYGSAPHPIEADQAETLAFPGEDGDTVFRASVDHPGTDPQPYFRPAINEVRLQGPDGFIRHNTRKKFEDIDSTREFVQTLALALERRISELAPVDSGNLAASIGSAPIDDIGDLDSW